MRPVELANIREPQTKEAAEAATFAEWANYYHQLVGVPNSSQFSPHPWAEKYTTPSNQSTHPPRRHEMRERDTPIFLLFRVLNNTYNLLLNCNRTHLHQ